MAPKASRAAPGGVAATYRKLDHREHVMMRPGMYVGSMDVERCDAWVHDAQEGRMVKREVAYVPALLKVFDEVLMNAVDHSVRLKTQKEPPQHHVRKIQVTIDRATGVIEVTNDGDGIAVEMHPEHGCYVPELIFGHLLTSANYDDDAAAPVGGQEEGGGDPVPASASASASGRIIGGQNGIGAKACNIFSSWFELDLVDHARRLHYTQRFEANMSRALPAKVRSSGAKKPYTTVRFLPDYARFAGCAGGLNDDMHALMVRRVYDATAVTGADVAVWLDGAKLDAKSFERYVDMYLGGRGEAGRAYEAVCEGWEVAAGLSAEGTGLQHVSFVNGVATLRGGKHVDHVVGQITRRLADLVEQRRSKAGAAVTVRPQFIRDNLFVFVRATVPSPAFDSQSKETLTTPASKFGIKVDVSDKFIEKLYKLDGLVDRVVGLSDAVADKTLKKTDGAKRSTIYGVKKLEDAEWAGTAKSQQCTLILTEGDSAKAMAVAGLAVVGRERFGVFPLRGKILNVCDVNAQRIGENEEIANIKKILGLQAGRAYESTADLRYGRVMALTDADLDGSHIKGLLMNLFALQWPTLLRIDGFMTSMLTPVVKAWNKKAGQVLSFYNVLDFKRWSESPDGQAGTWRTKYYKGLGTSTAEEAREYFKRMRIVVYKWEPPPALSQLLLPAPPADAPADEATEVADAPADEATEVADAPADAGVGAGAGAAASSSDGAKKRRPPSKAAAAAAAAAALRPRSPSEDALALAFDKKRADERKAWLQGYDPEATLEYGDGSEVTYTAFIHRDLVHYSSYDLVRSIPSVIDGLKVSQRKVLFACFKRNLQEEVRVAQLAGYVSEHAAYHHGEASLHTTIIGMAQGFVGSGNNVQLLEPVGQFGTRLQGGHDSASPRYIHTHLTRFARLVFPAADNAVLRWLDDDGVRVEPAFYLPVLPLVLVNGALGIGTGYSTNVPCHDPVAVLAAVRAVLRGDPEPGALKPWYRGFRGDVFEHCGRTWSRGVVSRGPGANKLRVTELPLMVWTGDFKEELERFVEAHADVKGFKNESSEAGVDFTITFASREAAESWMSPAPPQPSAPPCTRIEAELKLVSNRALSTSNMHLFNARGQIRNYASAIDVVREYVPERLDGYVRRREAQLEALCHEALVLSQKSRFVELVCCGELQLHARRTGDDLDGELEARGLARIDGSYRYLLTMHMASMTSDSKAALDTQLSQRRADIASLEATTPIQLWEADMDAFERAWTVDHV